MYSRDTIAAISTGSGAAAVAIVRVSGADALAVAARVFRGLTPERWIPHRLYPGRFVDADERVLDHGLGVVMRTPRSYTGEDVVELHGHGGVLLSRRLLASVIAAGARPAAPGEFTLRAFLNGKLDLAQAESVADLIAARTDAALRVAVDHLGGALSQAVEELRERVVGIAARLEVAIDFSEEDVGDLDRAKLADDASGATTALRELAGTYRCGRILREGLRVVIVGKPNVGKSSLLNRLLQSDRAIVTPIPGTTRDLVEEALDIGGLAVVLTDTAGIRETGEEIERIGIERTREAIDAADVAIIVLDNSRAWEDEDAQAIAAVRQKPSILLINKADLESYLRVPETVRNAEHVVCGSALTGAGIDSLRSELIGVADVSGRDAAPRITITRERHRLALEAAAHCIERAGIALRSGDPPEVVAVDIMSGLDHLGEIVGRTSPEAVLDRIFGEFCIGK
ncbi:MAG TPA: tRNA uridine-5-carboxymethylaminomethyl(34) synthesis GTPase MnmE [Candidatus Binatia bacterium]|nr:tRNA uridine-5-carboxymethylaminomethyl(34) synthesis GTPase MnmE [Candidatus Binatia bacterium]